MNKKVVFSLNEVQEYFKNNKTEVVSFDIETSSLKYYDLKMEGISFCNGVETIYIDLLNNQQKADILGLLRQQFKKIKVLIAHNIVFDLKVLRKYNIPYEHCELFCTMVADHLLDENRLHSLKKLAETILDKEVATWSDTVVKGKKSKEYYEYALNDAIWTWELMEYQKPRLIEQELFDLFKKIEMPFQLAIVDMQVEGVLLDKSKIGVMSTHLVSQIFEYECLMLDMIGAKYTLQASLTGKFGIVSKINFGSNVDLAEILFTKLGLDIVEHTPKGKPSVGKNTIEKLKNKHPFVELLHKYKTAQKMLNAFVLPLPDWADEDGKIRPEFKDTGTKTGRLSCRNPNLQQIPRKKKEIGADIRECFVAPKGYKMIACDYSGQELRVLTEITQEPKLIEMFNQQKDLHLSTANDFFNLDIPEEALYASHKDNEVYKDKYKEERTRAKIINFGIAYGKAQPLDCKIMTPLGWSTFKEIKKGDMIFTAKGEQVKVLKTTPICNKDVYKVIMKDGSTTEAADDHLWMIQTTYDKQNKKYRILTTKEIIPILKKGKQNNCFIDYIKPLNHVEKSYFVHPYLMGLYLGDGDSCNRYSIFKPNILQKASQYIPEKYRFSKQSEGYYAIITETKRNSKGQFISNNEFINEMRRLGMNKVIRDTKFIPDDYLKGSIKQKQTLLQGLLDSDGSKNNNGYEYVTISKRLAEDVIYLVKSLGGRATMTSRIPKTNFASAKLSYRLFISFPPYQKSNSIERIDYVGKKECKCITIEDKEGLYITDDFIVTHNSSYGFSQDFSISEDEAQKILDKYFGAYPAVKGAIETCYAEVQREGYVTSMTGRRRRFTKNEQGYYPGGVFRQAFNFLIQGYSADMMRLAINKVRKNVPQAKLIATVHDEAVYIVKEDQAETTAQQIKKAFETAIILTVPVVADVSYGNSYSDVK